MNKKKIIYDKAICRDEIVSSNTKPKGFVTAIESDTGKVLFKKLPNKIMAAGSAFAAAKIWNITPDVLTTTYNNYLNLDNTVNEPFIGDGVRPEEKVFLFCVGIDGCGNEASQVFDIDPSKWIDKDHIIPFRYQNINNDLGDELRDKYFGKKTSDGRIAYYFKSFDSQPVFIQQYTDGTPIQSNLYDVTRKDEIESYVELKMSISKDDLRDFFISNVGIKQAKVNSISLLTGWKKVIDNYIYYQDVRPYTKFNFPNEHLIDPSKSIDFTYQLYY